MGELVKNEPKRINSMVPKINCTYFFTVCDIM